MRIGKDYQRDLGFQLHTRNLQKFTPLLLLYLAILQLRVYAFAVIKVAERQTEYRRTRTASSGQGMLLKFCARRCHCEMGLVRIGLPYLL